MNSTLRSGWRWLLLASLALLPLPAFVASAQAPASPTPSDDENGGPIVTDSSSGYIDSAIPATQIRFRYDASYHNGTPSRAEFFWPKGSAAGGPGTPLPESNVDYQDIATYLELAVGHCASAFVEFPVRFLNPDINDNTAGFGDLNAGFKYALCYSDGLVASFQFRTYAPTGDGARGLGTEHVSLEPALLVYKRLTDCWILEAEFRDWIPIGGTDFAGNVIRYGLGASYHSLCVCDLPVVPVVEFVGWTVLDGKVGSLTETGLPVVSDADGDTIFNVKIGLRTMLSSNSQLYLGYGRKLSHDHWYDDAFRLEVRLFF